MFSSILQLGNYISGWVCSEVGLLDLGHGVFD